LNLMEAVVERENMLNALRRVVGNKGAAGMDAMGVEELKPICKPLAAHQRTTAGRQLSAAAGASGGDTQARRQGMRKLGVPTVVDRLIQQAMHQVLNPLFDPDFSVTATDFGRGAVPIRHCCQAREQCSGRQALGGGFGFGEVFRSRPP
jgi:RNA-directed DNA polymerase